MSARILVAEDDIISAKVLLATLDKGGYESVHAVDGQEALETLRTERFDLLITDWMMPRMDGIALLRQMHGEIASPPLALMLTGLGSDLAKSHALDSGAEDFLVKPIDPDEVLQILADLLERRGSPITPAERRVDTSLMDAATPQTAPDPPCAAVALAAGGGGAAALLEVLRHVPRSCAAAIFAVTHGRPWVIEELVPRLEQEIGLTVKVPESGMPVAPGVVYVAPWGRHLTVHPTGRSLMLTDDVPENLVRPSADVLFRSVASAFGRHAIAAVLTGTGRDGRRGVVEIAARGGIVLAQDPDDATAPGMPRSALSSGVVRESRPLSELAETIAGYVERVAGSLRSGGVS